jgi:hypothetical protein
MEQTIDLIIEDIKGYRTFSDVIDIRFVVALLESYKKSSKIAKNTISDNKDNYPVIEDTIN